MRAAVAAGHPATAEAGAEVLEDGGSAADAAVAASLASCVAETVMTGLLGGGHVIYYDAGTRVARNLDCFCAVPGLGGEEPRAEVVQLEVPFGTEIVHYAIGIASAAVPGLPAGLEELWRVYGRLPWPRLVEPALRLARDGVELPPAHAACLAMLEPAMTLNEGARIYAPHGKLLEAGDRLEQPGLADALETLAAEGGSSVYRGSLADTLLGLMGDRGGLVTRADLEAYRVLWAEPVETRYLELRYLTRAGLSRVPETVRRLPSLRGIGERRRVLALVPALSVDHDVEGDTTNITVVDADGNACVLTTSLGLGSGDFLPGLDLHLNSMLGEADLIVGRLSAGERMESMMAPSVVVDRGGALVLAAGAAGGTRLRPALLETVSGVLDQGLEPAAAVERARFHAAAGTVHAEPGVDEAALGALEEEGWEVRRWQTQHHFFGGVSVVGQAGAGADPRRNGLACSL